MSAADFLKAKNEELAANGSRLPNGPQVASASAGLDRQILAEQATPVPEQKPSEPLGGPKVVAMVEMSGQPVDNPGKAALLKPVETLTQSEMTDMINSAQGDYRGYRSGDPLKAHTYERVQDWHAAMYGDGPQANARPWRRGITYGVDERRFMAQHRGQRVHVATDAGHAVVDASQLGDPFAARTSRFENWGPNS